MSNAAPFGKPPPHPPREFSPLPALLSFLVPGLGPIYQGRVGKGVLFLVCIYALFFYGMYLGGGTVQAGSPPATYTVSGPVYLPQAPKQNAPLPNLPGWANDLYNRPQYLGQFWVGVVAWPALLQYLNYDENKDAGPIFGRFERDPVRRSAQRRPHLRRQAHGTRLGVHSDRRRAQHHGDLQRLRRAGVPGA